jgi:hypothetical protein
MPLRFFNAQVSQLSLPALRFVRQAGGITSGFAGDTAREK